jgi:hypothetical protein
LRSLRQEERENHKERKDHKEPVGGGCTDRTTCAQNKETCLSLCSLRSLWQEQRINHKERKDHKDRIMAGVRLHDLRSK